MVMMNDDRRGNRRMKGIDMIVGSTAVALAAAKYSTEAALLEPQRQMITETLLKSHTRARVQNRGCMVMRKLGDSYAHDLDGVVKTGFTELLGQLIKRTTH
jgi:hypothetical protein